MFSAIQTLSARFDAICAATGSSIRVVNSLLGNQFLDETNI